MRLQIQKQDYHIELYSLCVAQKCPARKKQEEMKKSHLLALCAVCSEDTCILLEEGMFFLAQSHLVPEGCRSPR